MNVKLIFEKCEGPPVQPEVALTAAETVVGRHRDCTLRIPYADVSRRHCILHLQEERLTVKDLDSLNGTFVNGTRIAGERLLLPGDKLEVGPVIFAVDYDPVPAVLPVNADTVTAAESATLGLKKTDGPLDDKTAITTHADLTPVPASQSDASTRLDP